MFHKQGRCLLTGAFFATFLLVAGCSGGGGGGNGGNGEGGQTCLDCNVSQASYLHLDSANVSAFLSIDQDTIQSSALSTLKAQTGGESTTDSPIQGVEEGTGDIRDALRCFTTETGAPFDASGTEGLSTACWDAVPRIVTIAECNGTAYLVFERPFIVRTTAPGDDGVLGTGDDVRIADYSDPWSPSSPFTSQLMRTTELLTDYQAGDRLERANLEGVLFGREINTWDRRRNVQFDGDCNLYVTIRIAGTSKDILIKVPPGATENQYTEVINANIEFQSYLVTNQGDVHYTGQSCTGGDCQGGSSFYRMVAGSASCGGANAGQLTEIARDWWNYAFEPEDDGTVVFYGPDPTAAGVPSWDSSCLFRFDSCQTGDARYSKLVNCINDWNRYVQSGPDQAFQTTANDTERERCSEQFYTYRGSNTPDSILSIDRDGDGTKEICVVADTDYKLQGTWKCDICVNGGNNCENASGMITSQTTQAACTAAGGTWHTPANGPTDRCYNQVTTDACTISTLPSNWDLNHSWCEDPGSNWSQSYSALSCIHADRSVEILSSPNETVTDAWVVGNALYYSSVEDGQYAFKQVSFGAGGTAVAPVTLVSGVEMYEVTVDPSGTANRLMVNGLRFSDNSYIFGYLDLGTGQFEAETGLTGLVEAVLIIGGQ